MSQRTTPVEPLHGVYSPEVPAPNEGVGSDTLTLSVIIPTRNRADLLREQLAALAEQEWEGEWEVLVADNGSTDGATRALVEEFRELLPGIRFVDASRRRGPAHARNVAAAAARGESLVFVDDDDVVQPGWLAAMAAALEEHQFIACARDDTLLNPPHVQRARGNPQRDALRRAWYPPYLPYAGGCGLAVSRELFDRVRGFDESLPVTQDNDFCFKVQVETRTRLHFVPDATIAIRCRTGRRSNFLQQFRWARYHVLLFGRYCPPGERIPRAWRLHLYQWKEWLKSVPRARTAEARVKALLELGWLAGQLFGAVRHRTTPVPVD